MAHEYPVTVNWSGGVKGTGELALKNLDSLPIAVDTALNGLGEGTNPEELLTCAVASCYAITFGIIAANKRLPVESISANVTGILEGQSPNLKFKAIQIRPVIKVNAPTEEQRAQIEQTAHRAEQLCIISNTVRGNVEITVEPTLEEV